MGCSGWDVGGGARGPFGLGVASHSTAQDGSSVTKFTVQVNIMICGVGVSEGGVWGGVEGSHAVEHSHECHEGEAEHHH